VIDAPDRTELYRRLVSAWHDPDALMQRGTEAGAVSSREPAFDDFTLSMMFEDLVTFLPDDILVKLDRASMAVSLEARAPMLDHRVVEWAWRLPMSLRIRSRTSKWLLRRLVHRYVPPNLIERPKTGFGIPVDAWLRGPLRDWAEALLDSRRLEQEGVLRPAPIADAWREHLAGHRNNQARLWPVLMFQAWREAWLS
jgi:asparagine synthase (glutamine-hydrolysing)